MSHCEVVGLSLGEVIGNSGDLIRYVYFPTEGIISWEKQIAGSPSIVICLIGNEGMLNMRLVLGVDITPCRAVVQKAGFALRIASTDFIHQLQLLPELNLLVKRYTFVTYSQLLQTSACNLFHVLENRLAKLILSFQDRSHSAELHITQELFAQMLGVRRVGVTKAAGSLQRKNLISYSRGNVIVHNSKGLKAVSCLCYEADKEAYAQFLHLDVIKNDALLIALEGLL
ncbi:MAG: Crp/Fnr family transcriptional regulator [Bdellovibrio sp.]|nr:Crp/Fnr family transcriptional regulator [Methylotenera sp.]